MSAFFSNHGIPTVRGARALFAAIDEARTNEVWNAQELQDQVDAAQEVEMDAARRKNRELEIKAKRVIEGAIKQANHVLRNIHTSTGSRVDTELGSAAELLQNARVLLASRTHPSR
jgi:hypothetical protein